MRPEPDTGDNKDTTKMLFLRNHFIPTHTDERDWENSQFMKVENDSRILQQHLNECRYEGNYLIDSLSDEYEFHDAYDDSIDEKRAD